MPGKHDSRNGGQPLQLLGVDHRGTRIEWNRAAGIARATSARNDREVEFDAALDQAADFFFGVWVQNHKRILDAPVGRIRDVRHPREAIERDVVPGRETAEHAPDLTAQLRGLRKIRSEAVDRFVGRDDKLRNLAIAHGVSITRRRYVRPAPALDLVQAMTQRFDEQRQALRIIQEVVLQIRIAFDDPDIAQHLEQHSRGTTRPALAAKILQYCPHWQPEQPDDDFAVGERRVVVRNLAQARCFRVRIMRFEKGVAHCIHDHSVHDEGVKDSLACYRSATSVVVRRPWPTCFTSGHVHPAIADSFRDVHCVDALAFRQVGDRARHFEHAVVRACRQREASHREREEVLGRGFRHAMRCDFGRQQARIGLALAIVLSAAAARRPSREPSPKFPSRGMLGFQARQRLLRHPRRTTCAMSEDSTPATPAGLQEHR